jgi:RNA polymerase sigma-70 factor (ECF subfamily)
MSRRPPSTGLEAEDVENMDMGSSLREHATPESNMLASEIGETVTQAIEKLPEDLRTAIVLREIDGLSYDEIAKVMTCPIGTVRSRIFRAREAIDLELRPLISNKENE